MNLRVFLELALVVVLEARFDFVLVVPQVVSLGHTFALSVLTGKLQPCVLGNL